MIDICSIENKDNKLISIEQALTNISLSTSSIEGNERVTLKKAFGRVLSYPVVSAMNIPPERNSAMDGYAFSSKDIKPQQGFNLTLVGTSWAGKPYPYKLQNNECIRIFTGAVVPNEADSVIMQEHVEKQEHQIIFPESTAAKQNIRQAGSDIEKNSQLLPSAKKLSAIDIGLLASAGIYDIDVKRKLNISFLSTGDELCPIGQSLEAGQIYDSNRYTLDGLLNDNNYNIVDLGVIADDKQLLKQTLLFAAESSDIIISTGGASVGDADYIKEILDECGDVGFWKIAIKPGKPLAFGKIKNCCFFGLPGNPVSVIATFQKIVLPALQKISGITEKKALSIRATCSSHLKKQSGRQEYQRGILSQDESGNFHVKSAGKQGSNIMSAASCANCYIVLAVDCEGVLPGQQVLVEPFSLFI